MNFQERLTAFCSGFFISGITYYFGFPLNFDNPGSDATLVNNALIVTLSSSGIVCMCCSFIQIESKLDFKYLSTNPNIDYLKSNELD